MDLVSAIHEIAPFDTVEPHSSGVVLRPLANGDEGELRRIHATTEVARWWGYLGSFHIRMRPEVESG